MENYMNTFFMVFLVTILISNPPQPTRAAGESLIPTACQNVEKKGFCNAMLESDPNSNNADLPGLGLIALKQAASNASDIAEYAKTLSNDPNLKEGAAKCLQLYLETADKINDSVASAKSKAHTDVNAGLNAAITNSKSCDAALAGHECELSGKNEVFRWLCENALGVNKAVMDGKN
ncbi:hypothetical protein F8388_007012 [Cannabis sativa]|uniref:Pectinesterase inhibitor domain-containing protein n=2 Tax=Cannabis sativa TaxID=3483 RepID=A0A7J6GPP6_CANSA|nr:hypothetical protein F8388_007012 [Cannabis sativa]KAF4384873.1 hypothetical protein G4B88_000269 [Cannabis sativa]